ncbi:hypothetical protein BDV97DRAFT_70494 [Delphinella strobiligena]|nr:hypothetical protein BDV97DRAFT_70494 [Delphinella strobiligena]
MEHQAKTPMSASVLEATQAAGKSTTSVDDYPLNNMERNLENSSPSTPESKRTQIETHHVDADLATPHLEHTATPPAQLSPPTIIALSFTFTHKDPAMSSNFDPIETPSQDGHHSDSEVASIEWCTSTSPRTPRKTTKKVKIRQPCNSSGVSKPVSKSCTASRARLQSIEKSPTGKTPSGGIVVGTSRGLFRF